MATLEGDNDGGGLKVNKAGGAGPQIKQPAAATRGEVPKVPFRFMFSGPSGSGKTNLARWLLDNKYKGFFGTIHLFSPTAKLDHTWKKLPGLKKKNMHTELTPEALGSIFDKAARDAEKRGQGRIPHQLVIFDDAITDTQFMNSKEFLRQFIAGRHGNISSYVMTQSYTKVPRAVRLQVGALAMFPSLRTEIERLYFEHGPPQLSKNQFIEMVEVATRQSPDDKFPFFFLDKTRDIQDRFRRNLDQSFTIRANDTGRDPGEGPEDRKGPGQPAPEGDDKASDEKDPGTGQRPAHGQQGKRKRQAESDSDDEKPPPEEPDAEPEEEKPDETRERRKKRMRKAVRSL